MVCLVSITTLLSAACLAVRGVCCLLSSVLWNLDRQSSAYLGFIAMHNGVTLRNSLCCSNICNTINYFSELCIKTWYISIFLFYRYLVFLVCHENHMIQSSWLKLCSWGTDGKRHLFQTVHVCWSLVPTVSCKELLACCWVKRFRCRLSLTPQLCTVLARLRMHVGFLGQLESFETIYEYALSWLYRNQVVSAFTVDGSR